MPFSALAQAAVLCWTFDARRAPEDQVRTIVQLQHADKGNGIDVGAVPFNDKP